MFSLDDFHYVGESLFMFLFYFEAVYLCNRIDAGSLTSQCSFFGDQFKSLKPLRILSAIFINISYL